MPASSKMVPIRNDGVEAYCDAYAKDPVIGSTVYLSLIGYKTALKALWAAFLSKQFLEYDYDHYSRSYLGRQDKVEYRAHAVALPENGAAHLVVVLTAATRFAERGQPFFVLAPLADSLDQIAARFGKMFDQNIGVPALQTWYTWLWQAGLKERLIEASGQKAGIALWRVEPDMTKWETLVEQGITKGRLTP